MRCKAKKFGGIVKVTADGGQGNPTTRAAFRSLRVAVKVIVD